MRTALNLDASLFCAAKQRAASEGLPLSIFVEEALRARLGAGSQRARRFKLKLVKVKGWPAGLNVDDRGKLYDRLERP